MEEVIIMRKLFVISVILITVFLTSSAIATPKEVNATAYENQALQSQLVNVMESYVDIQTLLASNSTEGLQQMAERLSSVSLEASIASEGIPELSAMLLCMSNEVDKLEAKDIDLFKVRKLFRNPSSFAVEIVQTYLKQDNEKYKVFYCPVWKYKWVQTDTRAASPLHRKTFNRRHHIDRNEKHFWKTRNY